MEIILSIRTVYGKVLAYPANETARLVLNMTGKKTLRRCDVEALYLMGGKITWRGEATLRDMLE